MTILINSFVKKVQIYGKYAGNRILKLNSFFNRILTLYCFHYKRRYSRFNFKYKQDFENIFAIISVSGSIIFLS